MSARAEVRALGPREDTAWLGMIIFLASWAMMFASLVFAGAMVRSRLPTWPPPGMPALPRLLPAFNTLVLGASSLCLQRALAAARLGQPWQRGVVATIALGLCFVVLQVFCWAGLVESGLRWPDGALAGIVSGFTGFHALHVVVGLFGLAVVVSRGVAARLISLRLWTMYWHFVGVVWLALCLVAFTSW